MSVSYASGVGLAGMGAGCSGVSGCKMGGVRRMNYRSGIGWGCSVGRMDAVELVG